MNKYSDIISDGGMDPRNEYDKCSEFASKLYKTRGQRNEAVKALKHLVIVAQKDEINKDHLDQALRKARNVIADIDPTVERCDCCY